MVRVEKEVDGSVLTISLEEREEILVLNRFGEDLVHTSLKTGSFYLVVIAAS